MNGHCLCGLITWEMTGKVIATAVCHCDHCQRQSGSAFSVNIVGHESQLTVDGKISTYEDRGESGDDIYVRRNFCGACGSPIYSELVLSEGVIAVKAGTLSDKSSINPTVEAWCEHKQSWIDLPNMEISLDREG